MTDGRLAVSVVSRAVAAGRRQWAAMLIVACAGVAADQVTKEIVRSRLALGDAVEVTSFFSLHHIRNTGIAFGLFPGAASPVTILTAVAVAWMLFYFARAGARHPFLPVAFGFLLGGSVSNLADRLRQGYVTDFLDPDYWPAFNLGDVFITVGVIVLLAIFVIGERRPRLHPRRHAQA
ncbi:MAG: signal peptidase II [Thermoleophilia bacterium]|nr:signal peptidase II [Thermoleophilia bacterium]